MTLELFQRFRCQCIGCRLSDDRGKLARLDAYTRQVAADNAIAIQYMRRRVTEDKKRARFMGRFSHS